MLSQGNRHVRSGVKMRKALYEQMLSELHPITDIERRRRQRTNS
jgi:hypothetical protein